MKNILHLEDQNNVIKLYYHINNHLMNNIMKQCF